METAYDYHDDQYRRGARHTGGIFDARGRSRLPEVEKVGRQALASYASRNAWRRAHPSSHVPPSANPYGRLLIVFASELPVAPLSLKRPPAGASSNCGRWPQSPRGTVLQILETAMRRLFLLPLLFVGGSVMAHSAGTEKDDD